MHYVNLAAAIDTLTYALRCAATDYPDAPLRPRILANVRDSSFAAGISYAIGMMLDPATAAIIEQAARDRAEEDHRD